MKDYKRLTERTKHGIAVLDDGERFVLSCGGYATTKALNRLAELEDKIEDGMLVDLPCKCIEELDTIKDGMIFIFYKMCLEQNLGQGVFLKYKSKVNEWFKNYLKNKGLQEKGE